MCVLSIKVPIRKKSGNLLNAPRINISDFLNGFRIVNIYIVCTYTYL